MKYLIFDCGGVLVWPRLGEWNIPFGAAEIRTVQHSEFDYVFVHGLVNTVSAMAPAGAPSAVYSEEELLPGIWYVMPTYRGDHMSLQGGMTKHNNIRPFYMELLEMIDALA